MVNPVLIWVCKERQLPNYQGTPDICFGEFMMMEVEVS